MVEKMDALEFLKRYQNNSIDIIFCDPPYHLGSKVIIGKDNKPMYAVKKDINNSWDTPDEMYWEEFFIEANRILKYGGFLLMYSIDRQNFLFKYYAHYAKFEERQSLYWYKVVNFPKTSDLSSMIDKFLNLDRKKVESKKINEHKTIDVYEPASEISKKYKGYKYSVAPLKQFLEEIIVFQKKTKTDSNYKDIIRMELGDNTIACNSLNIENNKINISNGDDNSNSNGNDNKYPSNLFVDEDASMFLHNAEFNNICKYNKEEYALLYYCPRPSEKEKDAGLDDFEERIGGCYKFCLDGSLTGKPVYKKNFHPTIKPINLNMKILKLFKSPNPQHILIPFAGSGSEVIGAMFAGYEKIEACEINEEYIKIANKRIEFYKNNKNNLFN